MVLYPATTDEDAGVIKTADTPIRAAPAPPKELFLVSLWGDLPNGNSTS
jgi:hypothetical protein